MNTAKEKQYQELTEAIESMESSIKKFKDALDHAGLDGLGIEDMLMAWKFVVAWIKMTIEEERNG